MPAERPGKVRFRFSVFGFPLFIFFDRGPQVHDGSGWCGRSVDLEVGLAGLVALGSSTKKQQPCPNRDTTPTWPPCASVMRLTVARPSPMPGLPVPWART